tara:strand:+ start:4414 stop:5460 length:1047 start_codon:yes stop_codon:yes gene_type:complete
MYGLSSFSLNPFQDVSNEFEEFVYLLHICLNDQGLFCSEKMSRVTADILDENGRGKRSRYMFFQGDICLVLEQNIYVNQRCEIARRPSNSELRYHRCQQSLSLIHARSITDDHFRGDDGLLTTVTNWNWPSHPNEFSERIGEKIYNLVPEDLLLYMELPDDLSCYTQASFRSNDNLESLLAIIRHHIHHFQLRFESSEQLIKKRDLIKFEKLLKQESLDFFVSHYRDNRPERSRTKLYLNNCVLDFEDGSAVTVYGDQFSAFTPNTWIEVKIPRQASFPVSHPSGSIAVHRFVYSSIFFKYLNWDDQLIFDTAESMMTYLHLLHIDVCKTAQAIKSALSAASQPGELN